MNTPEVQIYSTYDAGTIATFDNFVYMKTGSTFFKPNRSCKSTDIMNIEQLTFIRDDNNEKGNGVHNMWSAVEMAISNLPQFTTRVWKKPSMGEESLLTPVMLDTALLDYDVIFTAKKAGIARVCIYNPMSVDQVFEFYINDVVFKAYVPTRATLKDANAYKMLPGDTIKIPSNYSRVFLLPYEYDAAND